MSDFEMAISYWNWLLDRIMADDRYSLLMNALNSVEYRWVLPMDENRSQDGLYLRSLFSGETGLDSNSMNWECTVLEMLIGLAYRCDHDIMGDPNDRHPELWFWEMLRNIGLLAMDNENFDRKEFDDIMNIWMDNQYAPTGEGSIFPVYDPTIDQTRMEIWDQMNLYLSRNYPI